MSRSLIHFTLILALAASLSAQTVPPPLPPASATQFLDGEAPPPASGALSSVPPIAAAAFEQPGPVSTSDYLPARLMSSALHDVESLAYHDGLQLNFRLSGPLGDEVVIGSVALINRIREIGAVNYLDQLNKTKEFGKALVKAGEDKINSVGELVKDPIGTVKRLPAGASRFFGRVGNAIKKTENGETDGNQALSNVLGVSKRRAQLAMELGVSPYSSNQALQSSLSSAARAMAGGALVVSVAGMAVDGGAGAALSVIGINQTLQQTLVESTPDELQNANRQTLLSLGVPPATVERFLMNPWFSPWQETIITSALKEIGINPTLLIQQACESLSEQDALYFIQVTRLYAKRHSDFRPLSEFRFEHDLLAALDQNGTLVVAISADLIAWTEGVASRAAEFTALRQPEGPIRALTLVTDGALSSRASEELTNRNIPSAASFLGPFQ